MLFTPSTNLPPKKSKTGIARGKSASGYWLRAHAAAVNPATPAQTRWRHIMISNKSLYAAIASGAAAGRRGYGPDPDTDWALCAGTYIGILELGPVVNNVTTQPTIRGTNQVEAYFTMVNNNRAQLGLPVLPTPGQSPVMIAMGAPPASQPAVPITWLTNTGTARTNGPLTAYASYEGTGSYSSPTPVTVEIVAADDGLTPFLMDTWDTIANYTIGPDVILLSNLGVFIDQSLAAGTYNVTVEFTQGANVADYVVPFVVSSPNTLPGEAGITFTLPSTTADQIGNIFVEFGANVLYDDTYTIATIAFKWNTSDSNGQLAYSEAQINPGPITPGESGVPCVFAVTASPQYTSSYSAPPASSWQPIGFVNAILNLAEFNGYLYTFQTNNLLPLWEATFGPLPSSGDMKIQLTPTDPDTGASGPTATTTVKWANGTLKGMPLSQWFGPQYRVTIWDQAPTPTSIGGSGPYTLGYPSETFPEPLSGTLYYSNTPGSPPLYGPCTYSTPDTETLDLTTPMGAPAPTVASTFFWQQPNTILTAPGTAYEAIALSAAPTPIFPSSPAYFDYAGTITPTAAGAAYITTGTPPKAVALPPGVTFDFDPGSITISSGDTTIQWIVCTMTAPSGVQEFVGAVKMECTDTIQTSSGRFTLQLAGSTSPAPPLNYLTVSPQSQPFSSLDPGTYLYTFTAENTGPNDQDVQLVAASNDPDLSFEFGQFATVNATATATSITFDVATGANVDALIGQLVSSLGYSPAGYNVTDAPIIANDGSTVTVLSNNNPSTQTVAGQAGLIGVDLTVPAGTVSVPGTAAFGILVTIPVLQTAPVTTVQITLSAGNNTCYCAVGAGGSSAPSLTVGFSTDPIAVPSPGTGTVTVTVSNTGGTTASVTLSTSLSSPDHGLTATLASTSLSVPAGTLATPGTASTTLTIVTPSGIGPYGVQVTVTAAIVGGSAYSILSITS